MKESKKNFNIHEDEESSCDMEEKYQEILQKKKEKLEKEEEKK